jgi:hypothetical protein
MGEYKLLPEVEEKYAVLYPSPKVVHVGIGTFDMRTLTVAQADQLAKNPRTAKYFREKPMKAKEAAKA